jgi:hypothetical protein
VTRCRLSASAPRTGLIVERGQGEHRIPSLLDAILLVLAPFAPLFSQRVWFHAQVLLLGAILLPRLHPVTVAVHVMGLSVEGCLTKDLGVAPGYLVGAPGNM